MTSRTDHRTGILLAVTAVIIWSGNFIVARDLIRDIPPISLNFYRWLSASLLLAPFALRKTFSEWKQLRASMGYLFWVALTGVSLFNSLVYVGAHYTTAINMALIGTTSSPVIVVVLARIFLNERIHAAKATGMLFCLAGVLFLLSGGKWHNLLHLHFSEGDLWMLLAASCFAVYTILVRKKPREISAIPFLFFIFVLGTVLLLPFFIYETAAAPPVKWDLRLLFSVLYLGAGASVICFLIWNIAISKLGAGRTALFGNLIPVFSSLEAVVLLGERITGFHIISFVLVAAGLVIANLNIKKS